MVKGDCLACQRLGVCSATNPELVRNSFTCEFFAGAPEPEYLARMEMIQRFGEDMAVLAMMNRSREVDAEE
jgi:hypothetical protein